MSREKLSRLPVLSFLVSDRRDPDSFKKGQNHQKMLASHFGLQENQIATPHFLVSWVTREKSISAPDPNNLHLVVGGDSSGSDKTDRSLAVEVSEAGVTVTTDWAGTIPCFYSVGARGRHLSNIEPCVFLATGTTLDDLDVENLYGFMRLSHLLWDETVWKHIKQLPPDSEARFLCHETVPNITKIGSLTADESRYGTSLESLGDELRDLNDDLIAAALGPRAKVILPLSSGYDSRMILAGLSQSSSLQSKTHLRTYGPEYSIEVQAAKTLARMLGMDWRRIEMNFNFLNKKSLQEIHAIFGASMHMHGMYQFEFVREVLGEFPQGTDVAITSGFMTGVPAGQHGNQSLLTFSQSKIWTPNLLGKLPIFQNFISLEKTLVEKIEALSHLFDGSVLKRQVVLDIWTRQRNFISYYPRTIEWLAPIDSPHMNLRYVNFFLSVEDRFLQNRKIVEQMFRSHFPALAKVPSNSNNFRLANPLWALLFKAAAPLRKSLPEKILPRKLRDDPFLFDIQATRMSPLDSAYPLLNGIPSNSPMTAILGGEESFERYLREAIAGSEASYERIVAPQAVALYFPTNTFPRQF